MSPQKVSLLQRHDRSLYFNSCPGLNSNKGTKSDMEGLPKPLFTKGLCLRVTDLPLVP